MCNIDGITDTKFFSRSLPSVRPANAVYTNTLLLNTILTILNFAIIDTQRKFIVFQNRYTNNF